MCNGVSLINWGNKRNERELKSATALSPAIYFHRRIPRITKLEIFSPFTKNFEMSSIERGNGGISRPAEQISEMGSRLSTPGSSVFSNSSASSRTTFVSHKSLGRRRSRKSLPPFINARNNCIIRQFGQKGNGGTKSKKMLSNLVGFFRGKLRKRKMREYELNEPNEMMMMGKNAVGNMHRTRSSLRRPQLLSVRQRQSVCLAEEDSVNPSNKTFELLLAFCKNTQDIAYLRAHPENLAQLGIGNENLTALFEELYFFLSKCEQLKEAEDRVEQRRKGKKRNNE